MSDYAYQAEGEMWDAAASSEPKAEWFNGDRIYDTGRRETKHGAEWRICRYMEGPKAGQELVRPVR